MIQIASGQSWSQGHRCLQDSLTSHLVQEAVFVAIEVSRPDDCGSLEGTLDELLALSLGSQERRR